MRGAAALSLLSLSAQAHAQDLAENNVDEVTVLATRQERRVDEAPATVSVITAERIEENLAADIRDLVRFEPGVSVRTSPSRFLAATSPTGRDGNAGFNIRGLDGNRVLIQVDGVRVPDAFAFGGQNVGRGDYVDLDLLKSVEILRGPASALYGSDGVAGAVSFTTKDPRDVLGAANTFGARARVAYGSADESLAYGLIGAAQSGPVSGLLAYTGRQTAETETQGANNAPNITRTTANPQDLETQSVLGKLVFTPTDTHRFRLTAEYYDRTVDTEVLSARAIPPLGATSTLDLDARDTTERTRVSGDYRYASTGVIDRIFAVAYYQTSGTVQFAAEDRNVSADRLRINTFDNAVWGAAIQFDSDASFIGLTHSFVYGGDYSSTRQEGLRNGTVPPAGETFPTRAFPDTDYVFGGAFLQDEISLFGDTLKVVPGLRYDYYDLTPEQDAQLPGVEASQSDSRVSPKIGLVYWGSPHLGFFANATRGFKAPAPSQVNNGFFNAAVFYMSLPNPNLRPETSETFEAGVRFRDVPFVDGAWSGSVTGYTGAYKNFIDQVQLSGNFTPANPTLFQFVNLSNVEISGWEARLDGQWASGFGLTFAAAATKGDQKTGAVSVPLNTIDPYKLVGSLTYRDPAGRFGGQLIATYSAEKEAIRVAQTCGAACFRPDQSTVIDVTGFWTLTDAATLRLGLFNLTDETYSYWSDVRGLAATSTVLDAYTQPGRNVSVSIAYKF